MTDSASHHYFKARNENKPELLKAWVAARQNEIDRHLAELPPLQMTLRALEALLEYSCSLPTGTTPGKRWRNHYGSYLPNFTSNGGKPRWIIGEYDPNAKPEDKTIAINWYRPVIRVPAKSGVI
jgi:hypothetical protein